jgi:hypothetical protein
LVLTNGYKHDVIVHSKFIYNETVLERTDEFYSEMAFAVAARRIEYNNIISIRIETQEGVIIEDYTLDYLTKLRNVYKNNDQRYDRRYESWVFTEKGLFLKTTEIRRRFNFDSKKMLVYYRSDKAVEDLNKLLEKCIDY